MILVPSDILANLPSIAVQEGVISASLNSSMVQNVIAGIYTMVYGGTMYFHISRKKPNRRIVVWGMSILYTISMITFIIEWWWLDQWMVVNGSTRATMFLSTLEGPVPSLYAFNNFVFYLGFVLSDVFLIWRCYDVLGMSLRVIAVPSIVCFAQSGLLIASTVLSSLARRAYPENLALTRQYNNVVSAFLIASLVTSAIATVLLGHKVHSVSRLNGTKSGPIYHVFIIAVESAAIYPIMLLALAIFSLMPESNHLGTRELTGSYYVQSIANIIAGMAPTGIMASIALKGGKIKKAAGPTTTHIVSELRFGSAPGAGGRSNPTNPSIQIVSNLQGNVQPGAGLKENSLFGIAETGKV